MSLADEFDPPAGADDRPAPEEEWRRWADLRPYLDGTVKKPRADAGAERDDGVQLLYPKRWHTVIGLTGCGKPPSPSGTSKPH